MLLRGSSELCRATTLAFCVDGAIVQSNKFIQKGAALGSSHACMGYIGYNNYLGLYAKKHGVMTLSSWVLERHHVRTLSRVTGF